MTAEGPVVGGMEERAAAVIASATAGRCLHCLRPMATVADWANTKEGERPDLCWNDVYSCTLVPETTAETLAAAALAAAGLLRDDTEGTAAVVGSIGEPFPMYGFEGCTTQNPDLCACATYEDVHCSICGEVIDPGTPTYARQEGLPWMDPDDIEQEWTTLWWHADCDTRSSTTDEPERRCLHRYPDGSECSLTREDHLHPGADHAPDEEQR